MVARIAFRVGATCGRPPGIHARLAQGLTTSSGGIRRTQTRQLVEASPQGRPQVAPTRKAPVCACALSLAPYPGFRLAA
jgi:hypothetical protein